MNPLKFLCEGPLLGTSRHSSHVCVCVVKPAPHTYRYTFNKSFLLNLPILAYTCSLQVRLPSGWFLRTSASARSPKLLVLVRGLKTVSANHLCVKLASFMSSKIFNFKNFNIKKTEQNKFSFQKKNICY